MADEETQKTVSKKVRTKGKRSAREIAIEVLGAAPGGQMKFGELAKEVSKRLARSLGHKLTWTPTYFLKSPGFSRPEKGVVRYSKTDQEKRLASLKDAKAKAKAKAEAKAETKRAKRESEEAKVAAVARKDVAVAKAMPQEEA